MRKENYPRFARRLRIVTATSILALFSLMVAPSSASFAYAQPATPGLGSKSASVTSTDIQTLKDQVNTLKSVIQTLRDQLSRLATAQSISVVPVVGPTVRIPPGQELDSVAVCPSGTQVTGGGFDEGISNPSLHLARSGPSSNNGWAVTKSN